jgi:endonuclease I
VDESFDEDTIPDDDPDDDPYASTNGLYDESLREALYNLIAVDSPFDYDTARDAMYGGIDVFNDEIECLYSGRTIPGPATRSEVYNGGSGLNCEHSWPKSQIVSSNGENTPPGYDIHHLFPTDVQVNSDRGTLDFGEVSMMTDTYCVVGSDCSYRGQSDSGSIVFEVRDSRKGDIARAHFYMAVRWAFECDIYLCIDDNGDMIDGRIKIAEEAVLRQWHVDDPVDERERTRNDRIEAAQGNRNPFVDRPDLVERLSDF